MASRWELEPEEILGMPLDELALRVLEHYQAATGQSHWGNWLRARENSLGDGDHRDVMLALSEAWGWLINHGLVTRTPGQDAEGAVTVSRAGHEALVRGIPWLRATRRLDVELTPVLEFKVRPLFLRGELETAVFMAMKEVEVAVRERAGFDSSSIGTKLMQEAFRPPKAPGSDAGPLHDPTSEPGEAVATMDLYKGAIGLFKNPTSHRRVDFTDPTEAAEIVLLADLLLRLLRDPQE